MQHTPLSRWLLVLALAPALVALLLGSAVLLALAGALLIVLVRARDGPTPKASVQTRWPSTRVQRNAPLPARLDATLGTTPRVGLAHQPLPDTFHLSEGTNLHVVASDDALDAAFTLVAPRRGRYALDPPTLSLVHPLGLAPPEPAAVGDEPVVTVEPIARPLRTVKGLRGPGRLRSGDDRALKGPASTEFQELRDYQRGDPVKHVNWKATAKRSPQELDLIVNEYEPEARKNIWFFLDLHENLEVGTNVHTALEDAIEIALALVNRFTARGHRVGGATYNGPSPATFYPDAGTRQRLIIARKLAHAQAGPQHEGLPAAVERVKGFLARERPLVFLVTRPELDPTLVTKGVRRIHQHTATQRAATPVTVLAPNPPHPSEHERLAHTLVAMEADQEITQHGSLLRVHRLDGGARGLEKAMARGVMLR